MEKEKEITFADVVAFIITNCDDEKVMDKINRMTFPFTSKFKTTNQKKQDWYNSNYEE